MEPFTPSKWLEGGRQAFQALEKFSQCYHGRLSLRVEWREVTACRQRDGWSGVAVRSPFRKYLKPSETTTPSNIQCTALAIIQMTDAPIQQPSESPCPNTKLFRTSEMGLPTKTSTPSLSTMSMTCSYLTNVILSILPFEIAARYMPTNTMLMAKQTAMPKKHAFQSLLPRLTFICIFPKMLAYISHT